MTKEMKDVYDTIEAGIEITTKTFKSKRTKIDLSTFRALSKPTFFVDGFSRECMTDFFS